MPPKNAFSIGCLLSQQTSAIHERLFLVPNAIFEKHDYKPLTSILSPQGGARRERCAENRYFFVRYNRACAVSGPDVLLTR